MPTLIVVAVVAAVSIRRARTFGSTLGLLLAITYAGGLVAATLFPIPIDPHALADMRELGGSQANLVPFATIQATWTHGPERVLRQLLGNVLLFVPLGVLTPALAERDTFRCWKHVVSLGLGVSLMIEGIQFCVSALLRYGYRSPDVDDVALNVLGAIFGLILYRSVKTVWHAVPRHSSEGKD